MKLSTHLLQSSLVWAGTIFDWADPYIPQKWKFAIQAGLTIYQTVIGVVAHYSVPPPQEDRKI